MEEVFYDTSYEVANGERVLSSSKVNFTKLSEEEKLKRFRNMAEEIKRLKAKLRNIKNYKSKKIHKV